MKIIKVIQIVAVIIFVISFWKYINDSSGNYKIFLYSNGIVIITLLIDYGYQIYKIIEKKEN